MGGTKLGLCVAAVPWHRCPQGHFGALFPQGEVKAGSGFPGDSGAVWAVLGGVGSITSLSPSLMMFLPLSVGFGITWFTVGCFSLPCGVPTPPCGVWVRAGCFSLLFSIPGPPLGFGITWARVVCFSLPCGVWGSPGSDPGVSPSPVVFLLLLWDLGSPMSELGVSPCPVGFLPLRVGFGSELGVSPFPVGFRITRVRAGCFSLPCGVWDHPGQSRAVALGNPGIISGKSCQFPPNLPQNGLRLFFPFFSIQVG